MVDYIKKLIVSSLGKSIIRKVMVLLAGVLLGIGVDKEVVNQFISSGTEVLIAVLLYIVAQGWSILERKALKAK